VFAPFAELFIREAGIFAKLHGLFCREHVAWRVVDRGSLRIYSKGNDMYTHAANDIMTMMNDAV